MESLRLWDEFRCDPSVVMLWKRRSEIGRSARFDFNISMLVEADWVQAPSATLAWLS
jgi:hypothetical protein